jgi:hypothetical protein
LLPNFKDDDDDGKGPLRARKKYETEEFGSWSRQLEFLQVLVAQGALFSL